VPGGSGTLFIDDIRLLRPAPQQTPTNQSADATDLHQIGARTELVRYRPGFLCRACNLGNLLDRKTPNVVKVGIVKLAAAHARFGWPKVDLYENKIIIDHFDLTFLYL
jgi:hypothetical protein